MKIHIPSTNNFVYPDAVVIFEEPQFYNDRKDIILNPLLIVEVGSPSTEKFDRNTKFDYYRRISTFKEYLLVRQEQPIVSIYHREATDLWRTSDVNGIDQSVHLKSIDCEISMKDIYDGIEFATG